MDRQPFTRRKFIKGVLLGGVSAVVLNALPKSAESSEGQFRFAASSMSLHELENQKRNAIVSLWQSIPDDPRVDYLREHARYLSAESQMYVPSIRELREVLDKSAKKLNELSSGIALNSFGLFIFADIDTNGNRIQRMYVLKKSSPRDVQFAKTYLVSTAANGFGNRINSEQTPLGLHSIHSGKRGFFGEVVSGLNEYKHLFNHLRFNNRDHWFVKNFGKAKNREESDTAEVVTDQYLLEGPETSIERGIRIHGTNRSGEIGPDGRWRTFLGGRRRSGGCIRMSNTDIRDLGLSGYIWWPGSKDEKGEIRKSGPPIMIYATREAAEGVDQWSEEEIRHLPPRRRDPDSASNEERRDAERVNPDRGRYRPPDWNPFKD